MGNNATSYSDSLQVCSDYFYDGGLIDLYPGCNGGTVLVIRREGLQPAATPLGTDNEPYALSLSEVRLYQSQNMLTKFGGVRRAADPDNGEQIIVTGVINDSVLNLSRNFRARSYTSTRKAFIGDNLVYEQATYDSCFIPDCFAGVTCDSSGDLTYTFPEPIFVHMVLLVQDTGQAPSAL